jgi:hypothetical protein
MAEDKSYKIDTACVSLGLTFFKPSVNVICILLPWISSPCLAEEVDTAHGLLGLHQHFCWHLPDHSLKQNENRGRVSGSTFRKIILGKGFLGSFQTLQMRPLRQVTRAQARP